MKLSLRFFLILLVFSLAPVLVTGLWMIRSQAAARENSRQLHIQISAFGADAVETFAGDMNRSLGFAQEIEHIGLTEGLGQPEGPAKSPRRRGKGTSSGSQDMFLILQREAVNHPALSLVSLVGPDGRETVRFADARFYPASVYEDRSTDPLIEQMRRTGRAAWGRVVLRQGHPLLPIAYPLPQNHALYIEHSLEQLFHRIKEQHIGKTGRLFLLDETGQSLPGFGDDFPEPSWGKSGPALETSGWIEAVSTKRGSMVAAWAACPSLSWRVLSLQPRSEALASSPHFVAHAIAFILGLAILVVLGAFWMGSRMAQPLRAIIAGAERASRNKFTTPVPESGWGELNALTRGFNAMMKTLRSYQEMQVDRLLEEKAKVEALVQTIPDGIVLANFEGNIAYMNLTARALLAQDSDPKKGTPSRTIHDTFREPVLRQSLLSLLQRKKVS